jgi:hypothetical protein
MGPWTKAATILSWLALFITPLTLLTMSSSKMPDILALGFNTATAALIKDKEASTISIFKDICRGDEEVYKCFRWFISNKDRWDTFLNVHGYENDADSRGKKRKLKLAADKKERTVTDTKEMTARGDAKLLLERTWKKT